MKEETHIRMRVGIGESIMVVAKKALILSLEHDLPVVFTHNHTSAMVYGSRFIGLVLEDFGKAQETRMEDAKSANSG